MNVHVVPFARIREIIGSTSLDVTLERDATTAELWRDLTTRFPALSELAASTRLVRNGAFVAQTVALRDGDEVGLLPPFGGG